MKSPKVFRTNAGMSALSFTAIATIILTLFASTVTLAQNVARPASPAIKLASTGSETKAAPVNAREASPTASLAESAQPSIEQSSRVGTNSASAYGFSTATNGTFTDMSSGTTQLVAAGADDTSSAVTNIGFDLFHQGTRYSQFSASSNGYIRLGGTAVSNTQYTLGTAAIPLITAYGSDLIVSTSGKVHYKVTGSAPNRVLTVEFLNMTIIYDGVGTSTDGTYQVRLYESTGVIEFVYGAMNRNTGTGFGGANNPQYVGFSLNSTADTFATVTTSTNTVTTTGTPASNLPTNNAPIPNLNTPVNGSRRVYTFTSPVPTAPTNLTFTGVTPLAMTLNWTDSPNEVGYAIYRSTDGINYSFFGTAAQNATSFNATGLSPSTNYFWQVYANSDGALSATALSGSQATIAPGVVTSTGAGGLWSATTTWAGGVVPTATDDVTIADGATVTIDTAAVALDVTVGQGASGILQFETTTARTLTVGLSVTIASGGTFRTGAAGAITAHVLSVGGNLTNNGTLDFSTTGTAANSCAAGITFTGATNNTFGGTGATTDIRTLTINKGTSSTNILELNPTNFTVQGTTTDGTPMAFLTLTNGTMKISGTFTVTGRVFTTAGYTIGATAGFWLNNPNFTVAGQNGSPTESGLLRISQGTFNIGTATGNSMGFSTGSTITVEGGAVNATGRFGVAAATNTITYTQSGGTITVCTIGNASTTLGSFDLGTSATSVVNISGGTIVVQLLASAIDYRYDGGTGPAGLTGGTLQLGNAASGAAKAFNIRGDVPNLVIDNTSAGHSATFSNTLVNFFNASLNITINTGCTLNLNGSATSTLFFMEGTTLTNNGTLTATNANKRLYWAGSTAQTYTGTGVVTAPLNSFEVDNALGVTLSSTNQVPVSRVILFTGGLTGANKFTLGNGGATSGTIQIGNGSAPTAAGTFDAAPTFNLGTAGQIVFYLRTGADRSTGPEINPARTLASLTVDPNGNNVNLVGDLTVTGTTTINTGNFVIGANTLTLTNAIAGTLPAGLMGNATSSLVLNGTVASNIPSSITQLNNFTLNNTGGSTLQVSPMTINGTLTLSSGVLTIGARTLNLNGPISVGGGSLTGGTSSQIAIGGSGPFVTLPAVSGGLLAFTVNHNGGVLLGAPLSIAANGFLGLIDGALNNNTNNVTLGNLASLRRDAGSIAAAPIFSGLIDLRYFGVTPVTTGPELPTNPATIYILEMSSAGITLAGNATVNLQLLLENGNITTGANVLTLVAGATVTRTSGYVDGNFARVFDSAFPFTYDVGSGGSYAGVVVSPTNGSFPTTLTVKTVSSLLAGLNPTRAIQRSWVFGSSGITRATLTFTYDGADIPQPANQLAFRVVRKLSSDQRITFPNGSTDNVDEITKTATATAITMPAFGGMYSVAQTNAGSYNLGDARPVELFDFDGFDGRTDIALWNGTTGHWTILNSLTDSEATHDDWGSAALGDILTPGDYDADGKTDLAVWRPSDGNWYVIKSSDSSGLAQNWGTSGDMPVPGDYDGDGKTDFAVFRPSEGNWYIINSASNTVTTKSWGASGDKLVPADYDGDGKVDIAIFRPSEGNWYVVKSSNGAVIVKNWGASTDRLVPGDYDGDGVADFAVWRPSEGNWYIVNSSDNSVIVQGWGAPSDAPVPGDYDRDGRVDVGVFRPSENNFYVVKSSDGFVLRNLGSPSDTPVINVP